MENNLNISNRLKIGDEFEIADMKWKILDITDAGYMCIGDSLADHRCFDFDSNDWKFSDLRKYLNKEFYEKISEEIGKDNIISLERDLLSLDGQTEYGTIYDFVSLLTVDEYRKYRKYIQNINFYWWLITPWSTPCNNYKKTCTVVSEFGSITDLGARHFCLVRPVCIFSATIFAQTHYPSYANGNTDQRIIPSESI